MHLIVAKLYIITDNVKELAYDRKNKFIREIVVLLVETDSRENSVTRGQKVTTVIQEHTDFQDSRVNGD